MPCPPTRQPLVRWKLGVAGLSGMGIFNFVVIVDTARKLWKFCVRTPMPLENARVAKDS